MRQYIINKEKDSSQYATEPFIDYDPNLKQIGVKQFIWSECIDMFHSDEFHQTPEENKRMIEYFYEKYSQINSNDHLDVHIEEIPFLLDQNNRLQLTKNIYFPGETTTVNERCNSKDFFVNSIIFNWLKENKREGIKEWLKKLGVRERTDLTYLEKTIIPNAATYIKAENAIETIQWLFTLFAKNLIGKDHLEKLKQLKLFTTGGTLLPAKDCFFSDQYKPRLLLEEYLKEKEDKFLSFDYVTGQIHQKETDDLTEWQRFFTMLGVQQDLCVIEYQQKISVGEGMKYGFNERYLTKNLDGYSNIQAYCGLKTITFLNYTKG